MNGWYQKDFDTWEEAVLFQREKVQICLDNNWPIRACEIADELDFDTKKRRYMVFVRPFTMEKVNEPTA